jgi:hypothetical protein
MILNLTSTGYFIWIDSSGTLRNQNYLPNRDGSIAAVMFVYGDEIYVIRNSRMYVCGDTDAHEVLSDGTRVPCENTVYDVRTLYSNVFYIDNCTISFAYYSIPFTTIHFEGSSWSIETTRDIPPFDYFSGGLFWEIPNKARLCDGTMVCTLAKPYDNALCSRNGIVLVYCRNTLRAISIADQILIWTYGGAYKLIEYVKFLSDNVIVLVTQGLVYNVITYVFVNMVDNTEYVFSEDQS